MLTEGNFAEFVESYIECGEWVSSDENDVPLWDLDLPLPESEQLEIRRDCHLFLTPEVVDLIEATAKFWELDGMSAYRMAGHDFMLTRNHHGAGFWDRGHGDVGDKLTQLSHDAGDSYFYRNGDNVEYDSATLIRQRMAT